MTIDLAIDALPLLKPQDSTRQFFLIDRLFNRLIQSDQMPGQESI